MKLNLGSSCPRGQYKQAEWVNVDLHSQGRPDVVGDGFQLPFKADAFDEVRSIHVLEHLRRDQWPIMLCEMYRVLKPGGVIYVEVPNFEVQCRTYLASLGQGRRDQHLIRTGVWGKTERPGMGHQFGFDQALLRRAMLKVGYDRVKFLIDEEDMISPHHNYGPVLLCRATKTPGIEPKINISALSFDELRDYIIQ